MASVNETNRKIDLTVRVFDEFYSFAEDVPAQEYDAVLSFFKTKFTDTVAAENFTTALVRVATQSQTSIMNLLQELQDKNQLELTATL